MKTQKGTFIQRKNRTEGVSKSKTQTKAKKTLGFDELAFDNPFKSTYPERFKKVRSLISKTDLNCSSRSKKEDVNEDIQVLLGDTMGELNFLYSLSDVAFVGGSLIDHGGQNLLEPAAQGLPLCSGPSLRNFVEISNQLKKASVLKIINNKNELANYFVDLINKENLLKDYGQASKEIFIKNRGAIEIIKKTLQSLFRDLL